MKFWIHCNFCYKLNDVQSQIGFYFLNCTHVYCENCWREKVCLSNDQCPFCRKRVKYMKINTLMDQRYQDIFFSDLQDKFEIFNTSVKIQYKQFYHLSTGFNKTLLKFKSLMEIKHKIQLRVIEFNKHYEKLRQYRRQLQEKLRHRRDKSFFSKSSGYGSLELSGTQINSFSSSIRRPSSRSSSHLYSNRYNVNFNPMNPQQRFPMMQHFTSNDLISNYEPPDSIRHIQKQPNITHLSKLASTNTTLGPRFSLNGSTNCPPLKRSSFF